MTTLQSNKTFQEFLNSSAGLLADDQVFQEFLSSSTETPEKASFTLPDLPVLKGKQLQDFIRTSPDALVGDVSIRSDTNGFADRLPSQQLAVPQLGQNPLKAAKRFGQQLFNFAIADVIDTATTLPGNITQRLLTSAAIKSRRPELSIFEIYDHVSDAPRTKRKEAERRAEQSIAISVPPAKGLAEKALDTTAGVIGFVGQLAILKKISPASLARMNPIAQNAVLFEAQNIATGGPPGEGAKMGAALGVISKLPLPKGAVGGTARTGLESGTFLGLAIEAGASEEDKLIALFLPVGFRVYGGLSKSFKKQWLAAKTPETKGKVLDALGKAVEETDRTTQREPTQKEMDAEVLRFEAEVEAKEAKAREVIERKVEAKPAIRKEPLVIKPTKVEELIQEVQVKPKAKKVTPKPIDRRETEAERRIKAEFIPALRTPKGEVFSGGTHGEALNKLQAKLPDVDVNTVTSGFVNKKSGKFTGEFPTVKAPPPKPELSKIEKSKPKVDVRPLTKLQTFAAGDRVTHNKRGPGVIIELERIAKRKDAEGFRSPRYRFKPDATGTDVLVQGTSIRAESAITPVRAKPRQLSVLRPLSKTFEVFKEELATGVIKASSKAKSTDPRDQYEYRLTEGTVVEPKGAKAPEAVTLTKLKGKGTSEERSESLTRKVEFEAPPLEETLARQEQTDSIARAIDRLSGNERTLVENEFGFRKGRGEAKETDTELAKRLKITEDQVVETRNTALDKLQKSIPPPLGRRGHVAVISDVGFEITELVGSVGKTAVRVGRAVPAILNNLFRRGTGRMRQLGEHGKKLADDISSITEDSQKRYNIDERDSHKALKSFSTKAREDAMRIMNGRMSINDIAVGNRDRTVKAVTKVRGILDRALDAWTDVGKRLVRGRLRTPRGTGRAYPQILNKRGVEAIEELQADRITPKTIEEINKMIEDGTYKNYETAIRRIKVFQDRVLRGVNGYLERTRVDLPEEWIEWDPYKTLPGLLQRNWLVVEATKRWGFRDVGSQFPFPKAEVSIREIEKVHSDDALRIRQFLRAGFGIEYTATQRSREISETVRSVQFITKIATSPLTIARNMTDRFFNKGPAIAPLSLQLRATLRYPPFINRWIKGARLIEDDMVRAGAVFGHGSIAEGVEPGRVITQAIGKPFSISERGNQVYLALLSSMRMQRDMARYLQDQGSNNRLGRLLQSMVSLGDESPVAVRRRLQRRGLLDKSNEELVRILERGELAPEELHAILHRASRDLTFPVILSTKRMWWDNHPWIRVMAQFKTWPVEQVGFIWQTTVKEAAKGNILPMARFIVGVTIGGEIYNIMRDAVSGDDEALLTKLRGGEKLTKNEITVVLAKDALDGGIVGMLADMSWGLTNWIFGPTGATAKDVGRALADSVQRPELSGQALKKLITKQLPLTRQIKGGYDKIQSENDGIIKGRRQYQQWRNRAFDWKIKQEKLTVVDHMREPVLGFIRGRGSLRRGKDTLAYELAADHITNNDVVTASKYLALVLRTTPLKDRADKIKGIRQSMRSRSPLGPVKANDRLEFMAQFTATERFEAEFLNFRWMQRFEEAILLGQFNGWPIE